MKKLIAIIVASLFIQTGFAQKEEKYIKEENVIRVMKTLTADNMNGRSAFQPQYIDKAAAFIESEFKKIGLKSLAGLKGYRQEFAKQQVNPETLEVTLDGELVAAENAFAISEKKEIQLSNGLSIKTIGGDTAKNQRQYFRDKIFPLLRDTVSYLVFIDPSFKTFFDQFKSRFGSRFASGTKYTKVFVLGTQATTYSIRVKQQITEIKLANVVGMLPGRKSADELIVFSGHYDHIGILKSVDGDSIANGADDDASGTTAIIELARYFKKIKNNERGLIFVAFTAEEIGGFGSQYFSEQLNPDKVMAMFNIEMIGKKSKWGQNAAFITGFERSSFGEILQKNLVGTPFKFNPDPYPEQNLFYRSDNATLARQGVPAHTISTDEIDIDKFYHTVNDEFETLDVKNIVSTIRAIALSSKTMVAGKDTPTRIDKSKVN
jgi:hypothetical protein